MKLNRFKSLIFLALLICVLMMVFMFNAFANDFPSSGIELMVPWPAGGGSDILMRSIAQYLEKELGVNVVVINKPGGGGAVGLVYLKNCKSDGYYIGMTSSAMIQTAYCSTVQTPIEDYEPIVFLGSDDAALTVRTDSPWKTLEDFIVAAKKQPGIIRNSNDTPGGASHLAALVLEKKTGIELNKIPYAGFAPSVAALAGEHVDSTTVNLTEVIGMYKAGKFRILGVFGNNRHFLVPEIPTMIEQDYDVVSGAWRIVVAPKGTSEERLNILEKALLSVLNNTELLETLRTAGYNIDPHGRSWTKEFMVKEDEKLYELFYDLGMVIHPKP